MFAEDRLFYYVVQATVVRAVQESSSPDTQKRIKELHVRHLSDLVISSDGKPVFELNFGICGYRLWKYHKYNPTA